MHSPATITRAAATGRSADSIWLPGSLHVFAALGTAPVFGISACVAGLLMASLASFIVFLPLTALALNGGRPLAADDPAPALGFRAQAVLLGLWTVSAWTAAALIHG